MPAASIDEILSFLLQAKKAVSSRNFCFEDREKNIQALARHGLTIDDVSAAIEALTQKDYCNGPEPDDNPKHPGDVWVFGHNIGEVAFYIKLKLKATPTGQEIACLSFHEPEYRMEFPYRTNP